MLFSAGIYLFAVINSEPLGQCEICTKRKWLAVFTPCSSVSIVDFEQVNAGWFSSSFFIISNEYAFIIGAVWSCHINMGDYLHVVACQLSCFVSTKFVVGYSVVCDM